MTIRKIVATAALLAGAVALGGQSAEAQGMGGTQAFGKQWAYSYSSHDWNRFYHYPYVFYPQNYYTDEYLRSAEDLYYRYPQEMRVPVYNRSWQNYFPKTRRYHHGHHFILDQF